MHNDKILEAKIKSREDKFLRVNDIIDTFVKNNGSKSPSEIEIAPKNLNDIPIGVYKDCSGYSSLRINEHVIDTLNQKELEAVVAHEMWHVKHDSFQITQIALMALNNVHVKIGGAMVITNTLTILYSKISPDYINHNILNFLMDGSIITSSAFAAAVVAPFLSNFVSRLNERMADSYSAKLTKNPRYLSSALIKLHNEYSKDKKLDSVENGKIKKLLRKMELEHLDTKPAQDENAPKTNFLIKAVQHLNATHPSLYQRISYLSKLI
jgi:Zn-dependent protease with chaperone function